MSQIFLAETAQSIWLPLFYFQLECFEGPLSCNAFGDKGGFCIAPHYLCGPLRGVVGGLGNWAELDQCQRNFDICFCACFERRCQGLRGDGGAGALGCIPMNFCDFANIPQFLKIQSVQSFGTSYVRFLIINIKFRFTCGEWNVY